ncbi:MAG: 50S ribosomal protein L25/general stress protein Ctc [Hyphomicrobiales bacterium]|nr:50S ribosomal protein L25/general stress protein Ctc [Hyphomicrobiales bacterium]
MADIVTLTAETRERAGKGAARATRRAGRVPGVIYGAKKDPVMISLDPIDLMKELRHQGFFARVYEISVGKDTERVLPRDMQTDPVTDVPIHVDFMRLSRGATINVEIEVNFINEDASPGLKRGGVLNVVRHEVELICPMDAIPESLTADLTGLDINDSVHISNITLPEGVAPSITDRDFTIATIAAPTLEEAPEGEEEGEAPAEAAAAAPAAEAEEGETEE